MLSQSNDDEPPAKRSRIGEMDDPFEDDIDENICLERLNRMLKPISRNYFCA